MARIYADEDFPLSAVQVLRRAGHEILTAFEAGHANQRISDVDVLAFAAAQSHVLLTCNGKDFIKLHAASPQHCGIIVCKRDLDSVRLATNIDLAIAQHQPLDGKLIRVMQRTA